MKISKVDHTKAAVVDKESSIRGILYTLPNGGEKDLITKYDTQKKRAKLLFNVFNAAEDDNDVKSIVKNCNNAMDDLLFPDGKKGKLISTDAFLNKYDGTFSNMKWKGFEISSLVTLYLRKDLKPQKDTVIKLLSNQKLSKIEVDSFLNSVKKYWGREELREKVVRSINHQNMIVQPEGQPEDQVFNLSSLRSDGKKVSAKKAEKEAEKEALKGFLSEYANLDEEARMDMLRRLRRIVDLYFGIPLNYDGRTNLECPDKVDKSPNYNPFQKHSQDKNYEGVFVELKQESSRFQNGEKLTPAEKIGKKAEKLTSAEKIEKRAEYKAAIENTKIAIRQRNIICYRGAQKVTENDKGVLFFADQKVNRFWIHHIESAVERIFDNYKPEKSYLIKTSVLCEKVWKDILNYISIKYIALGKAVFHFAMDDLLKEEGDIELGKIRTGLNCITSFDYEMIKAEETFQREVAVSVAFATNNFANAVIDYPEKNGKEDVLQWTEEDFEKNLKYKDKGETLRAVLQFFGGRSNWNTKFFQEAYKSDTNYETKLLVDIQRMLNAVRNETFHFTTARHNSGNWNMKLVAKMFAHDAVACTDGYRKKFYSNNLPMFYDLKNLKETMDQLYSSYAERASQVPAFNTVFTRKNFASYLTDVLQFDGSQITAEKNLQWRNGLYFLMKEIYYNRFLQEKDLYERVKKILEKREEEENNHNSKSQEARAISNFCDAYRNLSGMNFAQVCQKLMTEYNTQNSGQRKVKVNARNPRIYEHYKMCLYYGISRAFAKYVQEKYDYLKNPRCCDKSTSLTEFLPDWKSGMYNDLTKEVENNALLQQWYVMSRFLNAKTINQLAGSCRSYIQYVEDVEDRAEKTGNCRPKASIEKENVKKILEVLDVNIHLVSIYTNEISDYFRGEEEYAQYLSHYVDYGASTNEEHLVDRLHAFCEEIAKKSDESFYMDGQNVIMNRNVLMSKLYGPERILGFSGDAKGEKVYQRVNKDDINNYLTTKSIIEKYIQTGKCESIDEQNNVLRFQRMKNHIELRDVVEYGEIINELLGQLINWSFLRERDLLYYQLGFHYSCLMNKTDKAEGYKQIVTKDGRTLNGAILNQIAGFYISGVPVYTKDTDEKYSYDPEKVSTGAKWEPFLRYSEDIIKHKELEKFGKDVIYNAGLEIFENLNEHDNIVKVRNSIDHFKYYQGKADQMSILDLYSEVFDRFFTYDMKYKKNVPNLLKNILARHFVLANIGFDSNGKKIVGEKDDAKKKDRANLIIPENGLSSEKFNYILGNKKETCDAHEKLFLETVARILYFPKVPGKVIVNASNNELIKKESREGNAGNNDGGKRKWKARYSKDDHNNYEEYQKKHKNEENVGTSLGSLFANLNLK